MNYEKKFLIGALTLSIFSFIFTEAKADYEQWRYKILNEPTTTVDQMKEWAKSKDADEEFIEQAENFYNISIEHGVDPAVTYAQSAKETNFFRFTGVVTKKHHNTCGLKIDVGGSDTDKKAHKKFEDWEEGITAQVHHLALYAGQEGFPLDEEDTPDPRHFASIFGKAPDVISLSSRWAPSKIYGWSLAQMVFDLDTFLVDGKDPIPGPDCMPIIPEELLVKPPSEIKDKSEEIPFKDLKEKLSRVYRDNRYSTAVEIAKMSEDKGGKVIIASGNTYADALVAAGLSLDKDKNTYAPILLASRTGLDKEAYNELIKLSPSEVYIIGGEESISKSLDRSLEELGVKVKRISGKSRYETSQKVYDEIGSQKLAILVNANSFADATAISPFSAYRKFPILLTDGEMLDSDTESRAVKASEIIIVGGEKTVSKVIENSLIQRGIRVTRIAGEDRYETSCKIAKKLFPNRTSFL